jgi:hypothetical protein
LRLLAVTVAIAHPKIAMAGTAPMMLARINVCDPAPTLTSNACATEPVFPKGSSAEKEKLIVRPNLRPGSGTR